jgi:hypothetical protein
MLSESEYYTALHRLNDIPRDTHGKTRQNLRQTMKKQIKEYEYNLKYGKFEPLPFIPYFINKKTTEPTLHQLIQAATSSSEFTIDTESMNVRFEKNKPVLIQIQIILPYNLSLIILVECYHLPDDNTNYFKLIKHLFEIFFSPGKIIYIWGNKNELDPFVEFKLFSNEQLRSIKPINLQQQFKLFWNERHPHQNRSSTSTDISQEDCICERCIGKNPTEPWSIQDSIAFSFKEYLPKILTREKFYLGLDPNLFRLDHDEKQYRQELTNYALNDCAAMQRILIEMKNKKFEFKITVKKFINSQLFELSPINSSDDDDIPNAQMKLILPTTSNRIIFSNDLSAPSIVTLENNDTLTTPDNLPMSHSSAEIPLFVDFERCPPDWESMKTNENESIIPDWTNTIIVSNNDNQQEQTAPNNELSAEERRKIHNRTCTIKQRKRYYRNELIFENFDRRFTIKQAKMILEQQQIPVYIVNPVKSKTTNKTTLFAAVRNPESIKTYEKQSRGYFTTQHYNELRANGKLPQSNRRNQHHQHQRRQNYHQNQSRSTSNHQHQSQSRSTSNHQHQSQSTYHHQHQPRKNHHQVHQSRRNQQDEHRSYEQ